MFSSDWSLVLTVVFVATGLYSLVRWSRASSASHRSGAARPGGWASGEGLVDLNHLVMSVAMVVMVWWPAGTVGTMVQVVGFSVFAVVFLVRAVASTTLGDRLGALAHLAMNAAMVWMLAAMPLLMGPMGSPTSGGHQHGGGGEAMPMPTEPTVTAGWAQAVSWVAVVVLVVVSVWWLVRAIRVDRDRSHLCCHGLMGAGMALMLVAMR